MKNKYFILSIILILVFSLAGCSTTEGTDINEKVNSEIDYLDEQLVGMLNKLNNISFQKYMVVSEEINKDSATTSKEESGQSSIDESSEEQSNSSGESSGKTSGDSSSNESSNSESNSRKYSMKSNDIISRSDVIEWQNFNSDIENLYDTWSAITIDLYKKEINNNLILNFSTDLQNALDSIKAQDKNTTLVNLAKLYSYIPEFSSSINRENLKTNVLKTKSSLMNAYSLVDKADWESVQKELNNTEQNYIPILNDITSNKNKEYNINKAYILIKETQKSASDTNEDSFYINYRNLLQELEIIQG